MSIVAPPTSPSRGELLKVLGISFGVAVAIGNTIGAGILRAPAQIARDVPSGAIMLGLWGMGAVLAALEANVVAELATAMPKAGGSYNYARRALGDVAGLVVGWTDWMSNVAGIAALSVAFAEFLALIWPAAAHMTALNAVVVQILLYGMNVLGVRQGDLLQQGTSLLKAFALAAFCATAVIVGSSVHPHTEVGPQLSGLGWAALIGAYQLIGGAYAGWNLPVIFAEENADPGRVVPRALAYGIGLTGALYIAVNAALLYALHVNGMARTVLPFTEVLSPLGGASAAIVVAVIAMLIVASCANASIMAAPRILLALARDGMLPAMFRDVNKGGSPHFSFLLTAAATVALAVTGSFGLVFGLIATLNAASAILVIVALFVLRRREPSLARPWRARAYPWLPAFILIVDTSLFALYLTSNWLGALYAILLWLLCVPFAFVARRARAEEQAASLAAS